MDEASRQEEDELAIRQGGKVYPVGQVLRATYGAENHDSLGRDVTGLMLDLARVPYEPRTADHGDHLNRPEARDTQRPCERDASETGGIAQSLIGRVRSWWER